jgi:RNA recognition motif-containing protein
MNIFVGNLNPETVAEGLRKLFSEFGEVISAKVIIDNATGQSKGFGFVEMADKIAAQYAIDNLDVAYFEGNILSVKEARQNTSRPASGPYQGGSGGQRPGNNRPRPSFRPGNGPNREYGKNY